jgi:hypothetical protein
MRYQTITEALKLLAISHKANESFATGLESDKDAADNTKYPLIFLPPPSLDGALNLESFSSNSVWNIHLEVQEQLSDESTADEKQESLDRTLEILRDVYYQFILDGSDTKNITVNNLTETIDFELSTTSPFKPFITIGDGITGWMVDFSIQESNSNDLCHLSDVFT